MSLTTRMNIDVLLHLLKFLNPTDQFNLVLSGVLQGFENTSHSLRSDGLLIKLKYSYRSQNIEIGSLKCSKFDATNRNILENVSKAGYFAHVWSLHLDFEKTSFKDALTLKDLSRFFHFCPKLIHLCIQMEESWQYKGKSQIHADLASELSQGFNRLERVKLYNCVRYLFLNSWPIYQEILTWCGECKELSIYESSVPIASYIMTSDLRKRYQWAQKNTRTSGFYLKPAVLDLSLVSTNSNFGQKLQELKYYSDSSDELLKWLLPYCRNLHTLVDNVTYALSAAGVNDFLHLNNLRNLSIALTKTIKLKEILRNCLHLESLKVEFFTILDEEDLASVLTQPADYIVDLKLTCHFSPYEGSIGEILPVFKKWQHLRRLALVGDRLMSLMEAECPSLNLVCHLILAMKSLTYLCIYDCFNEKEMITLKRELDDWVKLHRPGFIFEMRNSKPRSSDDCWF